MGAGGSGAAGASGAAGLVVLVGAGASAGVVAGGVDDAGVEDEGVDAASPEIVIRSPLIHPYFVTFGLPLTF